MYRRKGHANDLWTAIVRRRKLFDLPPLLFGRRQLSISF